MQEAIAKNLPQMVGNELVSRLQAAEALEVRCGELNGTVAQLRTALDDARSKLRAQDGIDEAKAKLQEERDKLRADRVAFAEDKAGVRAVVAEAKADVAMEALRLITKNVTVRETLMGSVPVAVDGVAPGLGNQYGSPGQIGTGPVSTTTTRDSE